MSIIVEIAAAVLVAALLFAAFLRASPAALASAIRLVPPLLLGVAGFAVVAIGKAAAGSFMVALALAWLAATHLAEKDAGAGEAPRDGSHGGAGNGARS